MKIASVCRQTVFTYRNKVLTQGGKGLLKRVWNGTRKPAVREAVAEEFYSVSGKESFAKRGTRRHGSRREPGRGFPKAECAKPSVDWEAN